MKIVLLIPCLSENGRFGKSDKGQTYFKPGVEGRSESLTEPVGPMQPALDRKAMVLKDTPILILALANYVGEKIWLSPTCC